jgi:hypothetical protein
VGPRGRNVGLRRGGVRCQAGSYQDAPRSRCKCRLIAPARTEAAEIKGLAPRTLKQQAVRGHVQGHRQAGQRERDPHVFAEGGDSGVDAGEEGGPSANETGK